MMSRTMHTPKNNLHTHDKEQELLRQRQSPNKGMPHTKILFLIEKMSFS